ncbi:CRISPR-associated protein Cas1 [Chlorobium limicola DSM 245]|uniref:CRISPR-associated endonuclease Cas1 n=1 Tax=Chlorobium limicola (strain DSM 245 / NBRC 103803 / 6330) TaxID=290315 RepID=B3EIR7_CHLL2|nr:CRISPR-associated endonuclease Cas1 [Chlorobium limicola]ACD90008.1 CRISPR-associated protein Cas1 [Chlorobium limicola DSM 245]
MGWLYNQMAMPETIFQAWYKVASNDGRPGWDNKSIEDYSLQLEENLKALSQALLTGTYKQGPLMKLVLLKPDGKDRVLLIPGVMDRVAQTAAAIVLSPIIEAELGNCTFAYRPGISREGAAREIDRLHREGYQWVLDADIRSFFDNVRHDLLFQRLVELIDDKEMISLLHRWLTAEIVDGINPRIQNTMGLPQGCPISPALANLYLDRFDETMEKEGFKLVRFADDYLVLCKTRPKAEAALKLSETALAELKLELHSDKTRITTFAEGFKYLGYLFIRALVIPTKMHPEEWYDKLGKFKLRKKSEHALPSDPDAMTGETAKFELETDQGEKIELTKNELLQTEFGCKLLESLDKKQLSVDEFLEKVARQDEERQKEKRDALKKLYSPFLNTLYLQEQGSLMRKDGERFSIEKDGAVINEVIVRRIEQVVVFGNIALTTPVMQYCMQNEIPVTFLSQHGKYFGRLESTMADNAEMQRYHFLRSIDEPFALETARSIVSAKIGNSRTMIRRRKSVMQDCDGTLQSKMTCNLDIMADLLLKAETSTDIDVLRGLEGKASALYFECYGMFFSKNLPFHTASFLRVRRPPTDPVNSLLSFGYSLLHTNVFSMVQMSGLNPYIGFLHAERKGNPALVNDLVEEFRTVIDSLVLYTINRGLLHENDFYYRKDQPGCFLSNDARKRFLQIFETRMWQESRDGYTGKTLNFRRHIEKQVRIMRDVISGTRTQYDPYKLVW